jgi:hypothetical protein
MNIIEWRKNNLKLKFNLIANFTQIAAQINNCYNGVKKDHLTWQKSWCYLWLGKGDTNSHSMFLQTSPLSKEIFETLS